VTEIADFAAVLLLAAGAFTAAVLSTKLTERVPVPTAAIFLGAAAVVSSFWPSLSQHLPVHAVERVAVVALIVILFNGGMDVGWRRFRGSAGPILTLGVLGTFATAVIVAVVAHYALSFGWTLSGVVGAALSPTDPAVMFSVLGRQEIGGRSGTILEGEAGVNDPAGIALMLGMIEFATHANSSLLVVFREFAIEMAVGTVAGFGGAYVVAWVLRQVRLENEASYPILALVLAVLLYGVTAAAHGSGFLAVFIAGLALGDARAPYKHEIERFHSSLASLAELTVFVALGLTVTVATLNGRIWLEGVVLFLALALLARPFAVAVFLAPFRLRLGERAFIAWSGLKGAVPILLAAFAVLAHVDSASRVYGIVFVVVLLSVVGQGTFVPFVATKFKVPVRRNPALPWELSMRLEEQPHPTREFVVQPRSRAEGSLIRELPLGPRAWVTLVVREGTPTRPGGSLQLAVNDRVQILASSEDLRVLTSLFAQQAIDEPLA
jgi:cell volume regulation protein A